MQSVGQTWMQSTHMVQDQGSIAYMAPFVKIEFSGQMRRQLSHEIHLDVIFKEGYMRYIIYEYGNLGIPI